LQEDDVLPGKPENCPVRTRNEVDLEFDASVPESHFLHELPALDIGATRTMSDCVPTSG
jgi:hypothetical protein